jgi:hypothetical protein
VSLIYPALNEEPVFSARRLKSSCLAARRELGIPDSFDKQITNLEKLKHLYKTCGVTTSIPL